MNWVLIVFMFSPTGDYMDKSVTEFESHGAVIHVDNLLMN